MDVWIIAAAAGAGYVARRFKILTMDKCNCSNLSSENLEIAPESLGTVKKVHESFGKEICRQREQAFHDASSVEMTSTSGSQGENLVMSGDFGSWGIVSDSNSLPDFINSEDNQGDWEDRLHSVTYEDIASNSIPQPSSSEIGFSYGFRRNRSCLRSRRVNSTFMKPRTSLESCFMAQLYKEHAEMEEYVYSVRSPQRPIVRPFLVTDGSRVTSRLPNQSCSKQTGTGDYMLRKNNIHPHENMTVFCVPTLPNVGPVELQTRDKAKFGKESVSVRSNTSKMANKYQDNAQGSSSSDGALLFYLGLAMGITHSSLRHKLEMDKLRKSLKQTEDLVQDLQEELEMKDASTVKEIAVEDYESLDVHNDSYFNNAIQALSPEQKLNSDEYCDRNAEEESLRKIEVELEAELDRLASNINSSRLEGKLSNVAQLDPDFVSDVIEGDLRADLFGAKTSTTQAYADRDESGSSTTTTHFVHYPVSPRELSLRLQQVIQSRLEERVKELETALEQSQTKIKCMRESENTCSSNRESPITIDGLLLQSVDQPVVINLSGEALSAYNEAFEEFTKLSESDEEESKNRVISHPCKQGHDFDGSPKMGFGSRQEEDAHINLSNNVLCNSRDESEDGDDEMERLLIKQIVEKARQGSPAVLKVQRELLLSSDENYDWHQMGTRN